MGLYNFQERFVEPILSGRKKHTIRAHRRHDDVPGKVMHLYTGLRTKQARLLMRSPCVKVEPIEIVSGCSDDDSCECSALVLLNGVYLQPDEQERLARADGFHSFNEMKKFWRGRIPFSGHILHWK